MKWLGELSAKVRALKPADVQGATKKYLDVARLVRVRAGDLKE
jgi:hypothetical protein